MNTPIPTASGFDMNRPTIISLLYLASVLTGITGLIGVILAYIWKGEPHAPWEASHYQWHIRTFWIGALYSVIAGVLMLILIGWLVYIGVIIWFVIRVIKALLAAQKREAMPNPESWMI